MQVLKWLMTKVQETKVMCFEVQNTKVKINDSVKYHQIINSKKQNKRRHADVDYTLQENFIICGSHGFFFNKNFCTH